MSVTEDIAKTFVKVNGGKCILIAPNVKEYICLYKGVIVSVVIYSNGTASIGV